MTRHEAVRVLRRLEAQRKADGTSLRLKARELAALRILLDEADVGPTMQDLGLEADALEEIRRARRETGLSADGALLRIEGLAQHASDLGMSPAELFEDLAEGLRRRERRARALGRSA